MDKGFSELEVKEMMDEFDGIKPKKFRDKRTGEIVTRFNILDIKFMEEVKDE